MNFEERMTIRFAAVQRVFDLHETIGWEETPTEPLHRRVCCADALRSQTSDGSASELVFVGDETGMVFGQACVKAGLHKRPRVQRGSCGLCYSVNAVGSWPYRFQRERVVLEVEDGPIVERDKVIFQLWPHVWKCRPCYIWRSHPLTREHLLRVSFELQRGNVFLPKSATAEDLEWLNICGVHYDRGIQGRRSSVPHFGHSEKCTNCGDGWVRNRWYPMGPTTVVGQAMVQSIQVPIGLQHAAVFATHCGPEWCNRCLEVWAADTGLVIP